MKAQKYNNRVYLSGAITHDQNYKQAFAVAEDYFLANGFEVVNPAKSFKEDSYQDYMRKSLQELSLCGSICYVNDTTTSKGAFIERLNAEALGLMRIFTPYKTTSEE